MTRVGVLDHGYVELIRVDGNDRQLAQTARTSTDSSGTAEADYKLVDRLVRDRHTSPVEFGGFVFEIQMPIFIARQWMRHRAGTFNEFSLRYSEAPDLYYVPEPERCQGQSTFNKQGSAEHLGDQAAAGIRDQITYASTFAYQCYTELLAQGLTRELARMVLPVNFYTKVRWKVDLHNLMHFLQLREDPHAQWEIQQYAQVIHLMAKAAFPKAIASFENHRQNQVVISGELAAVLAENLGRVQSLDEDLELSSEANEFMRRY